MDTCPSCNSDFDEATATGLCPACEVDDTATSKPTSAIVALAISAIPFVFSLGTSQSHTVTVNGVVTESSVSGIDYVALVAGGVGVALGLLAAKKSKTSGDNKSVGIAIAAVLLGAYHVARGLYLF